MIKRGLLIALMLVPSLAVFSAPQPAAEKSVYVVTIIDVIPLPGGLGAVDALLRQFASDSRKDRGCVRIEVVRQQGRPNHYMILSVWNSQADFDAYTAAAHTRAFREKIQPSLGSPFDERLHEVLQ
jgi:quinol monooxygenase YgiN